MLTTPGQTHLPQLLGSYVPFLLVPLAMAVDYGSRLTKLAGGVDAKGAVGAKKVQ